MTHESVVTYDKCGMSLINWGKVCSESCELRQYLETSTPFHGLGDDS